MLTYFNSILVVILMAIAFVGQPADNGAANGTAAPADGSIETIYDTLRVVSIEEGEASYYGSELAGRHTASGEIFDPDKLTAAHPSLPMDTKLRVTNLRNDEVVIVRVNDRGPFTGGRVIDLSKQAAREIGMLQTGHAPVKIEVVELPD